jgi:microcystin-dependent protein
MAQYLLKPGMMIEYAGVAAPPGWVLCDGSAYTKTDPVYEDLYNVIQEKFNIGGEIATEFRVPDMRGRIPAGRDDMGGVDFQRLNILPDIERLNVGGSGGDQEVSLALSELPDHKHKLVGQTGIRSAPHTHDPTTAVVDDAPSSNYPAPEANRSYIVKTPRFFIYLDPDQPGTTTKHKHYIDSGDPNENHDHDFSASGKTSGETGGGVTGDSHDNVQPLQIVNYIIKL